MNLPAFLSAPLGGAPRGFPRPSRPRAEGVELLAKLRGDPRVTPALDARPAKPPPDVAGLAGVRRGLVRSLKTLGFVAPRGDPASRLALALALTPARRRRRPRARRRRRVGHGVVRSVREGLPRRLIVPLPGPLDQHPILVVVHRDDLLGSDGRGYVLGLHDRVVPTRVVPLPEVPQLTLGEHLDGAPRDPLGGALGRVLEEREELNLGGSALKRGSAGCVRPERRQLCRRDEPRAEDGPNDAPVRVLVRDGDAKGFGRRGRLG